MKYGKVYFLGIGGIGMSAEARYFLHEGRRVAGYDRTPSELTAELRREGAEVTYDESTDAIPAGFRSSDDTLVVYTPAIPEDHPQLRFFRDGGFEVVKRSRLLGAISEGKYVMAVAGTHGKTTTTSMATHIFIAAQKDPTVMIGGTLQLLHSGYRVGKGDTIIAESCEYCNSFLSFFPTVAVILNVEADHLDFFKDLADVEHSFRHFAELVPIGGHVVANMDDEGARDALRGISQPIFWFSYDDPAAQCRAENVVWTDGLPSFDIYIRGSYYAHVSLRVGGKHNVMNALAAASAAYLLGVSGEAVGLGLATFTGAGRRFEYKGSFHGADVYDDYAHHPGELHALLEMAKTLPYKRIICAFQPHTYTRTKALFNDFVKELRVPDVVVLAEIYAAREQNDIGISSMDLSREIPGSVYCPTLDKVTAALARIACPGDLILTVGAGDIFKAGEKLLKEEK